MAKAAKWSLPSWVQTPFRCRWRAPVSSTLIQGAALSPARSTSRASARKASWPAFSSRTTWRLEMSDADRPELGHQARHGHLALVVLGQHEAAQLGPEVAGDAGRHRGEHGPAVGGQPALAAQAHHVRAQHQVLDQEVLVALEARAGGDVRLDDALLVDGEPVSLAPATASPVRGTRLGPGALLHAAGPQLGAAFDALERRDLGLQLGDHLPQSVILGQQPLGESLQLSARQARKADLSRSRHGGDRSGPGRFRATASAHLGPGFCPSNARIHEGSIGTAGLARTVLSRAFFRVTPNREASAPAPLTPEMREMLGRAFAEDVQVLFAGRQA